MHTSLGLMVTLVVAFVACSDASPPTEPSPSATTQPTATPTSLPAPTATPWVPAADLEVARQLLRQGEFEAAAASFRAFAEAATDPEVRAQALLGAAVALGDGGDRPGSVAGIRHAIAAAPEGSRVARQAAYLLGVRLNETEAYFETIAALWPFIQEPVDDVLQPYLAHEYARAAWRDGDYQGASDAWETVLGDPRTPPRLRNDVYQEQALVARARGDPEAERIWVTRYVSASGSATGRLDLARLLVDAGETTAAADQLRAIVANNPGTTASILAIAELDALGASYNLGEAGLAYYRARRYAQARDVLLRAVQEQVSPVALIFRNYYLAAAYEGLGNYSIAISYYDAAAAISAQSPFTHRAKYWAARLTEDLDNPRGASSRYLALVRDGPGGEFTSESAFRAGYALLRADDPTAAVATWEQVGAAVNPRLLYWQGRAYSLLGNGSAATASYEAAIAADPGDFHAFEAARQLGRSFPGFPAYRPVLPPRAPDWDALAAWVAATRPGSLPQVDTGAARDLLEMGLRAEARQVVLDIAADEDPWKLLAGAKAAYELGLADSGIRLAIRLRTAVGTAAPAELERLLYPLDYVAILNAEGEKYGFDPLFFAGLIRQESLWDPSAGSFAGALGLTQVIPPTGESIARALEFPNFTTADLLRPAVSLRFGAYYIGTQLSRFQDPYMAMAAYNGGPGNAARWSAAMTGSTPADFLAAIDFAETELYVELVWENYARYTRLYREAE